MESKAFWRLPRIDFFNFGNGTYSYFVDEMQKGAFKRFKHEHFFSSENGKTLMKDVFNYESPLGILGKIADQLFLETYMTNFLIKRNQEIKRASENGRWKEILNPKQYI